MVSDPKTILRPTETALLTRVLSPVAHLLWKPVELKVELRNGSNSTQSVDLLNASPDQFVQLTGPDGKPVRFLGKTFTERRTRIQVKPGETVTLFETRRIWRRSSIFLMSEVTQLGW